MTGSKRGQALRPPTRTWRGGRAEPAEKVLGGQERKDSKNNKHEELGLGEVIKFKMRNSWWTLIIIILSIFSINRFSYAHISILVYPGSVGVREGKKITPLTWFIQTRSFLSWREDKDRTGIRVRIPVSLWDYSLSLPCFLPFSNLFGIWGCVRELMLSLTYSSLLTFSACIHLRSLILSITERSEDGLVREGINHPRHVLFVQMDKVILKRRTERRRKKSMERGRERVLSLGESVLGNFYFYFLIIWDTFADK